MCTLLSISQKISFSDDRPTLPGRLPAQKALVYPNSIRKPNIVSHLLHEKINSGNKAPISPSRSFIGRLDDSGSLRVCVCLCVSRCVCVMWSVKCCMIFCAPQTGDSFYLSSAGHWPNKQPRRPLWRAKVERQTV